MPGGRIWTGAQVRVELGFLRACNRDGYDIYFVPYAGAANIEDGNITFFGMGRNALAYPDFARDILAKGSLDELRVCKTLTYCTYLMRQKSNPLGQFPTGCPPFDKAGYGQIMKEARAAQRAAKG